VTEKMPVEFREEIDLDHLTPIDAMRHRLGVEGSFVTWLNVWAPRIAQWIEGEQLHAAKVEPLIENVRAAVASGDAARAAYFAAKLGCVIGELRMFDVLAPDAWRGKRSREGAAAAIHDKGKFDDRDNILLEWANSYKKHNPHRTHPLTRSRIALRMANLDSLYPNFRVTIKVFVPTLQDIFSIDDLPDDKCPFSHEQVLSLLADAELRSPPSDGKCFWQRRTRKNKPKKDSD
jgi:hypothetical protein